MASPQRPPADPLSTILPSLRSNAATLNRATDELSAHVSRLDSALQDLNLGIQHWVHVDTSVVDPESDHVESISLGYAKINGTWGIAVNRSEGIQDPDDRSEDWLFRDAPRDVRLRAIEALPKLLRGLEETSRALLTRVLQHAFVAGALADAITGTDDELGEPEPEDEGEVR